jgi:hypothetical protein
MSRATRIAANQPGRVANAPVIVVDGFLPGQLAMAMRRDIETHFARPDTHARDTHQVWNYWFIPELYTYLRTDADRVIGHENASGFHTALRQWSTANLGLAGVTSAYLSLYVDGCRQGWHNDSLNGRFAFVYSLTRNERRTIGGETLVQREGDPFRSHLAKANAGRGFYEAIEPRFNRLVVFDDRLPHAVERVEGSMDPVEGRFVLHGHLREAGAIVAGALPAGEIAAPLNDALARFAADFAGTVALYHGILSLRVTIGASGAVEACDILVDRVVHPDPGHVEWEAVRASLIGSLKALKFAPTNGRTVLLQPVMFGATAPGPG